MKRTDHHERTLRWYPPKWRARYGPGLAALLDDTYGDRRVPLRVRASLARAGALERAREVGVLGDASAASERLRTGSLLVLCGWSLFVVVGTVFAKFTEHWSVATPVARRSLPSIGDSAVQWAGALSIVIVLVAAVIALPTLANLLRARGWSKIRRPVLRAALAVATVVVSTAGLAFWAHQLNYHQRNGGLFPYGIGVLITGLVALVALATVTSSVITVTRQLDFSRQTLRLLSSLALGLTTVMGVIVAGVALWWASEATFAPHVLESSIGSGIVLTSSALPPALVVAGVLMVLGLTSALVGSLRVLGGFKQT